MFALFVNAAILILAAATFHKAGHYDVAEIGDAYKLLTPLLGSAGASDRVRASRCSPPARTRPSPATLAGQIVMEGFINVRLPAWLRRLITRLARHHPGGHRHRALWGGAAPAG